MSVLSVVDLARAFGPDDIFQGVSFSIPQRARIGLVGPNGVGKTTLIRILAGEDSPTEGQIFRARNLKIGYLPQNASFESEKTLWEECLDAFSHVIKLREELSQLEARMVEKHDDEDLLNFYGKRQHEFELLGGYTYENRIRQTLTGLSFSENDYQRPLSQLSGGQRTRAFLGKLLLSSPDLLLLDEPTNHLDIEAIEWLESFFKEWNGAVLIVSHDRYFLDQVVNTILEMTPVIETFRGNYSAYMTQREERYRRRLEEFRRQQEFIQKEEDYITRNIAGQNTRQAQGRRKRLERLLKDSLLIKPKEAYSSRLNLDLQPVNRSGDLVIRTRELQIGYHDDKKVLFEVPDLLLKRTECAAVIGPNGAGKTTFLKTILGQLVPLGGEVMLGASLKIGYFAQAHEDLHENFTLMEEIEYISPGMLPAEIRSYLARFLFTEDDVFKQVNVLSGGERGRLALACLALQGANLLLLDEPTNHLDLPSQEILQSILHEFPGTILLVSHDRYLIDGLATQIWQVQAEESTLRIFEGTYSQFRSLRQEEQQELTDQSQQEKKQKTQTKKNAGLSKHELKLRKERLLLVEMNIVELETRLEKMMRKFENPDDDEVDEIAELGEEYQALQEKLDEMMTEWAQLSEILEANGKT